MPTRAGCLILARYVGGEDGGVHCIRHDRHARGAEARAEDLNEPREGGVAPAEEPAQTADDIMPKGHEGARRKGR